MIVQLDKHRWTGIHRIQDINILTPDLHGDWRIDINSIDLAGCYQYASVVYQDGKPLTEKTAIALVNKIINTLEEIQL